MNEQTTPKPTNGVRVTIGGEEFTLRYSLRAMREAEQEFGGSITLKETLARIPMEDVGKLLIHGLREHHPDLTLERLEVLIDPTQAHYLFAKYREALGEAVPVADPNAASPVQIQELLSQLRDLMERAEKLQAATATSTGSTSGASAEPIFISQSKSSGA